MAKTDVTQALRKLHPALLEAEERNLNEADTRLHVVRLLTDVLGYDELSEVTSEQRIRHRYVDFAVRIDGVTKFLIEVKAAKSPLRDRHIEQAEHYAAQENSPWVLLTNAVVWNLYHLTFEEGIDYVEAFSVDLRSDSIEEAASLLGILHRKAIAKRQHEKFWEERVALSAETLGRALFTKDVLNTIRREVRHDKKILVDPEDLAKALHDLFTTEARESMGPVKIRKSKKSQKRKRNPARRPPQPEAEDVGAAAAPSLDSVGQSGAGPQAGAEADGQGV